MGTAMNPLNALTAIGLTALLIIGAEAKPKQHVTRPDPHSCVVSVEGATILYQCRETQMQFAWREV